MPKRYHIPVKPAPLELELVSKYVIERGTVCINCGKCTKVCIYEAHQRRLDDPRRMAPPRTAVCRNCFRCIQECPRGALVKSLDKGFRELGGAYWKPDLFISLWKQAEDGKVPVSGAGYRGPFTGSGFDGMWTDMSEIVRPTRDGIHGREYISTSVELGRKLDHLAFDGNGGLVSPVPRTVDLPLPILFDLAGLGPGTAVTKALARAAAVLGTGLIIPAAEITADLAPWGDALIPSIAPGEIELHAGPLGKARLVEVAGSPALTRDFPAFRERAGRMSEAVWIVRIPVAAGVEDVVVELARQGAEVIHLAADYRGREIVAPAGAEPRYIKDVIRSVHTRLVEAGIRDELTLLASGGMAMAEHVPKAMLCGADLAAVDMPLLIALGARLYEEPELTIVMPGEIGRIAVDELSQRIVNLMGAWHSQLLEVMGAMGIREARRLRGETGRAIFFEEIDREAFGSIFHPAGEVPA